MPHPERPFLPSPGDRVAVVAPSSPLREDMLHAGLGEVRRLGLDPAVRDDVVARHRFTAGPDTRRKEELGAAVRDPAVRAIWAARGGHGCLPLLRTFPVAAFRADPKPILGESDITALGCLALLHGLPWLHAPMVATALRSGPSGYDEPSLRAHLFGLGFPLRQAPPSVHGLSAGSAEGILWGGCLSILSALGGTPWLPRLRGAILFVEDVGVKPYQVHRMLVQLREAGALEDLAGLVLGDFSDCVQHADQGYDFADVITDFVAETAPGIPVVSGWPAGHAPQPHVTLAMGVRVRLDVGADGGTLTWPRPAGQS